MRSRAFCRGKISPRCVPGRQSVASFALHVSQKGPRTRRGASWQDSRAVHPKRAGFGKMCAPCIRKAPQTAVGGYTARISCQEGAPFAARAPRIMHSAQILPSAAEQRERSQPRPALMGGGTGRGRLLVGRGDAAKGVRGVVGCRALAAKLASVKLRLQVSDADNLAES